MGYYSVIPNVERLPFMTMLMELGSYVKSNKSVIGRQKQLWLIHM